MTKDAKQELPMGVVVAVCAVVLAVVVFFGFRTFSSPRAQAPTAREMYSKADQLTLKSGGDFSKLSPDEQKLLDNMTLGHGKKYVESHYQKLASSGGK